MKTFNHTSLTLEEIADLPVIGRVKNEWRQRHIVILAHPDDAGKVISDGTSYDLSGPDYPMRVICEDLREEWPKDLSPDHTIVLH